MLINEEISWNSLENSRKVIWQTHRQLPITYRKFVIVYFCKIDSGNVF